MSKLQIRVLTPSEWALYKSVRLSALEESPDSFGSTWARESLLTATEWKARLDPHPRAKTVLPLIGEMDGQAVALAWGLICDPDLKIAQIYQMWVSPAMRGKGIAHSLLGTIKTWALAKTCDRMALAVTTSNDAAMGLYLSYGFVPSGPLEELRADSALMVQPMTIVLHNAPSPWGIV